MKQLFHYHSKKILFRDTTWTTVNVIAECAWIVVKHSTLVIVVAKCGALVIAWILIIVLEDVWNVDGVVVYVWPNIAVVNPSAMGTNGRDREILKKEEEEVIHPSLNVKLHRRWKRPDQIFAISLGNGLLLEWIDGMRSIHLFILCHHCFITPAANGNNVAHNLVTT